MQKSYILSAFVAAFVATGALGNTAPTPANTAHCYWNTKTMTWRIGNEITERTITFDRTTGGLRTTHITSGGGDVMAVNSAEGSFSAISGGKQSNIGLDRDWEFAWQSVGTPEHGGRKLTIHLSGVRSHSGLEAEAEYEVYPGTTPYISKMLTLVNQSDHAISITGGDLDKLVLAEPTGRAKAPVASGIRIIGVGTGAQVTQSRGAVSSKFRASMTAAPNGGRVETPKSIFFAYKGANSEGDNLSRNFKTVSQGK